MVVDRAIVLISTFKDDRSLGGLLGWGWKSVNTCRQQIWAEHGARGDVMPPPFPPLQGHLGRRRIITIAIVDYVDGVQLRSQNTRKGNNTLKALWI